MNKMRTKISAAAAVVALVLLGGPKLAAGENYQLETSVYVFKNGDFPAAKFPAAKTVGEKGAVVGRSPATVEFGPDTLSLKGGDFSWSGGNPPRRFSLISVPRIVTGAGQPVEIQSAAPVQYLEKKADGTLEVRNIDQDDPEAPHCRIRFTVGAPDEAGGDLRVSCLLDVATISARASVPGVNLEIGRPLLARLQDRVEWAVRPAEWSALWLPAPNGSDYSLVLLLKIMPAETPVARAALVKGRLTPEELHEFFTYYYRRPQPELVGPAIESLGRTEIFGKSAVPSHRNRQDSYSCVGFFAEIFAANPARVAEWQKLVDRPGQDGSTQYWLRQALGLGQPGKLLALGSDKWSGFSELEESYVLLGAFFASGNAAYVRLLANRLAWVDDADPKLFNTGAETMVLLAANAPQHPLLRQTLEAVREEAHPRTRALIDDLLKKDFAAVLQELRDLDHSTASAYAEPASAGNGFLWRRPPSSAGTKPAQP